MKHNPESLKKRTQYGSNEERNRCNVLKIKDDLHESEGRRRNQALKKIQYEITGTFMDTYL
jgi:hypothetical protein